jgi:hypothetical protein
MRIAYLADANSNNAMYRSIAPMAALEHCRGHEVRALPGEPDRLVPPEGVRDVDVLHIHRYCEARAQALAREAKQHGAAVVWDNDDDMASMPRSSVTHRHFGGYAGSRRIGQMQRLFRELDLVTAPSATLIERLTASGAPATRLIENYVIDHHAQPERRPHAGVTIGWVAGLEHKVDADQLPIRAVLQRLLDERVDVSVASIGLGLGLRSDRYRHTPSVPLGQLHHAVASFDIAIAPLTDIPFNRSRSNIKLKEYAAAGVTWLASPVGPYCEMGERQGGRLVPDDCWHAELVRLLEKPRERRKLAKRAGKWGKSQMISRHAGAWEQAFGEAIAARKRSE